MEVVGTTTRLCELRLGDFLEVPSEELEAADAVLLEVVVPSGPGREDVHTRLFSQIAANCRDGCVFAAYEDLHSLWHALPRAPACPLQKLRLCGNSFRTSWSSGGENF